MPKLNKKQAQAVEETESTSFEAMPPKVYPFRLIKVEVSENKGASGYHYWTTEWSCEHSEYRNRKVWANLSLSPKAAFKMKEFFEAFGVSTDTDTDDLCGETILLNIGQETQQEGKNKGRIINTVERFMEYDEGLADWGEDDGDDEEEPF